MFTVQYRCQHREYWYDQPEGDGVDWNIAVTVAGWLVSLGRTVRILDQYNRLVWSS